LVLAGVLPVLEPGLPARSPVHAASHSRNGTLQACASARAARSSLPCSCSAAITLARSTATATRRLRAASRLAARLRGRWRGAFGAFIVLLLWYVGCGGRRPHTTDPVSPPNRESFQGMWPYQAAMGLTGCAGVVGQLEGASHGLLEGLERVAIVVCPAAADRLVRERDSDEHAVAVELELALSLVVLAHVASDLLDPVLDRGGNTDDRPSGDRLVGRAEAPERTARGATLPSQDVARRGLGRSWWCHFGSPCSGEHSCCDLVTAPSHAPRQDHQSAQARRHWTYSYYRKRSPCQSTGRG